MIEKRIRARERRREQNLNLRSLAKHMDAEATFERMLRENAARFGQRFKGVFHSEDWCEYIFFSHLPRGRCNCGCGFSISGRNLDYEINRLRESFKRDEARLNTPYTDELIEIVQAARREKHRNLTNEKIRERRGEMTRKWLKRRRSQPPSLIRYRMTEKEKMTWWVSKCVSEVGYIGMLKRKLGMKLKDPDAWKRENGLPHTEEETARNLAVVEMGNKRRAELGTGALEE